MSGRTTSPETTLAGMFDESAEAYDAHWAPALHRHARVLCESLPPLETGARRTIVDVAAGTGALLPVLRAAAGPGGLVLALDVSIGMLRHAPAGIARVQADATKLPLADASADILVQAFVLFLLPDARAAVAEAARVLRPGGWLLAATWGADQETGAEVVLREEVEAANPPPFPDLPRSDELTDNAERMAALLEPAGFGGVHTSCRTLDARFDADSALALGTGMGKVGWRFARLDPAAQEAVRSRAAARLAQLPADGFVDSSEVLLTTARRT
ncbi:MAG: class I SAM-dependent methyltransferase [Pseudonocardiales bacterium]